MGVIPGSLLWMQFEESERRYQESMQLEMRNRVHERAGKYLFRNVRAPLAFFKSYRAREDKGLLWRKVAESNSRHESERRSGPQRNEIDIDAILRNAIHRAHFGLETV